MDPIPDALLQIGLEQLIAMGDNDPFDRMGRARRFAQAFLLTRFEALEEQRLLALIDSDWDHPSLWRRLKESADH